MDNVQNTEVIGAVRRFRDRFNARYRIDKTLLFGSRARGDWLKDSDVDLLLVSKDFAPLGFRDRMAEALDLWDEPLDLEVLCYTPDEYGRMRRRPGIVKRASEEGVEL